MILSLIAAALAAPNVLLIIADDVGIDKISSYAGDFKGYAPKALPATPTIDSLAASGLRFTQAWANPVCSPTRAGVYTGRHSFRTKVGAPVGPKAPPLQLTETTLAEALTTYASGMFGKWHLGEGDGAGRIDWDTLASGATANKPATQASWPLPLLQGWQYYAGNLGGKIADYWSWTEVYAENKGDNKTKNKLSQTWTSTTYNPIETTNQALSWIRTQTGPWFATVSYNAAHSDDTEWDAAHERETCAHVSRPVGDSIHSYQALVQCLDTQVADLLTGIAPQTLQNTVIIFMGDNGTPVAVSESIFQMKGRGKGTVFQSGVLVPLTITDGAAWLARGGEKLPDGVIKAPGRTVDQPAQTLDLFATITALAGASSATGEDSISLLPYFSDPAAPAQRAFAYTEVFSARPRDSQVLGQAAIRDARHKLILQVIDNESGGTCRRSSLYDLATDPLESTKISSASALKSLTATLNTLDGGHMPTWLDVPSCGG